MNIRAKLRAVSVDSTSNGDNVNMLAVIDDSEENESFSDATPSASLTMWVSNPSARGAFMEGREYYVDFTPA